MFSPMKALLRFISHQLGLDSVVTVEMLAELDEIFAREEARLKARKP